MTFTFNEAYVRAKVRAYPKASQREQVQILRDIGVCVGFLPAQHQNRYLPPAKADQIKQWLKANQVLLKLPNVEV